MKNRPRAHRFLLAAALVLSAVPPLAAAPAVSTLPPTASSSVQATATDLPVTYTVLEGDTFRSISRQFHLTVGELKKENQLTAKSPHPGQVLRIPGKADAGPASHSTANAPPPLCEDLAIVVSASTFASCPPPPDLPAAPDDSKPGSDTTTTPSAPLPAAMPATVADRPAQEPADLNPAPPSGKWAAKFSRATLDLAEKGIEFADSWRPPGEVQAWVMDCSNTTRYLYRKIAGIELPRTASDQYYYLHVQDKAWDIPDTLSGLAECDYVRGHLKPGDLLFWENTCRPERDPPITHVMVFLGSNEKGQWIMAGSQSSRGLHSHQGGPDIYLFNPAEPSGGYYDKSEGMIYHPGRFCAYGRPLEADASKLSLILN